MKASAAAEAGRAGEETNRYLAKAEKKRKEASSKLEELREASEKKWHEFTFGMNRAAEDFQQADEKAKSRFRE